MPNLGILAMMGRQPAAAGPPVSGYAAWWDATTLTLSNNDAVSSWADSSANGNDAANANGSTQPVFKTASLGGLASVLWDAGDSLTATSFSVGAEATIFCVANMLSGGSAHQQPFQSSVTLSQVENFISCKLPGISDYNGNATVYPKDQISCVSVRFSDSGDAYSNQLNGSSAGSGTQAAVPPTVANAILGASFAGYIGEIVAYQSALSDADVTSVTNYLMTKWGIT